MNQVNCADANSTVYESDLKMKKIMLSDKNVYYRFVKRLIEYPIRTKMVKDKRFVSVLQFLNVLLIMDGTINLIS